MPTSNLAQSMTSANFNTDDEDDDDDDDDGDGDSPVPATAKKSNGKGAKGRKKAAAGAAPAGKAKAVTAAQHRKEQNRAAQREFRQRKQQYIRALEARVELLSSDHDTQVNRLRFALRHLLAENNSLRGIVGSLSRFIGERSIGGCLVEAGMTREMLESTMNSSSEKVMSEAWANWPGAGECEALKEIRKESNIPADGLPESKLVNYYRDANNKADNATSTPEAATGDKKKRTVDNAGGKDAKRKRKTDETTTSSTAQTRKTTTSTSSNQSSPSTSARPDPTAAGQTLVASPSNMGNKDMQQQIWQTPQLPQQQQQPQMQYALPNQFWQPSQVELPRQPRNDVDSLFAQTLLGGGNPDLSNFAALFPEEAAMDPNYFPQNGAGSFNGGLGGMSDPIFGFGPATSMYGRTTGPPAMDSSASSGVPPGTNTVPPCRSTGGVPTLLLPSSIRGPPEHLRTLRQRFARVTAQVNRIWAKRGASHFLNLPNDYQLDQADLRFIEHEEATNPHIKLAFVRLPNDWDEGDMSDARTSGTTPQIAYASEDKADSFVQFSYHIWNHRVNANYSLPPILKPTPLQQSTPHDQMIDSLPWSAVRDKLIQMPDVELHSLLIDMSRFLCMGDGDVSSEKNWVLTLPFFVRYPQLADAALLASMNAHRKERRAGEVSMDEVWKEHHQFQLFAQAKIKELG